jgi:hypothetical protein
VQLSWDWRLGGGSTLRNLISQRIITDGGSSNGTAVFVCLLQDVTDFYWSPSVAVEMREASMGLAWISPALGRNVALDFAEFLFESIQTGLDRLLLCIVATRSMLR